MCDEDADDFGLQVDALDTQTVHRVEVPYSSLPGAVHTHVHRVEGEAQDYDEHWKFLMSLGNPKGVSRSTPRAADSNVSESDPLTPVDQALMDDDEISPLGTTPRNAMAQAKPGSEKP